ncbi:unnamed protein product [Ambrosiozyma monospora]|uniref:Unnamed protein product n=1 Tax=Ambrosiozyma monospora TaxID=43982 RepID=A0ACB5U3G8_AMBMO|nr:unnamed protein product [Ambrosiozyma monospora]
MSDAKGPISISEFKLAIKDLSDGELKTIKQRLTVSIQRLNDSNKLMGKLLKKQLSKIAKENYDDEVNGDSKVNVQTGDAVNEDGDDDDDDYENVSDGDVQLFKESIGENEKVIYNQVQRIEAIDEELTNRFVPISNVSASNGKTTSKVETTTTTDNDVIDSTAPNSIIL